MAGAGRRQPVVKRMKVSLVLSFQRKKFFLERKNQRTFYPQAIRPPDSGSFRHTSMLTIRRNPPTSPA
jgi:hypothetical protein